MRVSIYIEHMKVSFKGGERKIRGMGLDLIGLTGGGGECT
jgi:hypothetical protein